MPRRGWSGGRSSLLPKDADEAHCLVWLLLNEQLEKSAVGYSDIPSLQLSAPDIAKFSHQSEKPEALQQWTSSDKRSARRNFKVERDGDGQLILLVKKHADPNRHKTQQGNDSKVVWRSVLYEVDFDAAVLSAHSELGHQRSGQMILQHMNQTYAKLPVKAMLDMNFGQLCPECRERSTGADPIAIHLAENAATIAAAETAAAPIPSTEDDDQCPSTASVDIDQSTAAGVNSVQPLQRAESPPNSPQLDRCDTGGDVVAQVDNQPPNSAKTSTDEGDRWTGTALPDSYHEWETTPDNRRHLGRILIPNDVQLVLHHVRYSKSGTNQSSGDHICVREEMADATVFPYRNDAITVIVSDGADGDDDGGGVIAALFPPAISRLFHDGDAQSPISAAAVDCRQRFHSAVLNTVQQVALESRTAEDYKLRSSLQCPCNSRQHRHEGTGLNDHQMGDILDASSLIVGHRKTRRDNFETDKYCTCEGHRSFLQAYWSMHSEWKRTPKQLSLALAMFQYSYATAKRVEDTLERFLPDIHEKFRQQTIQFLSSDSGKDCSIVEKGLFTGLAFNHSCESWSHLDSNDCACGAILTLCSDQQQKVHYLRDFHAIGGRGIGIAAGSGSLLVSQPGHHFHGNLRPGYGCLSLVLFTHKHLGLPRVSHLNLNDAHLRPLATPSRWPVSGRVEPKIWKAFLETVERRGNAGDSVVAGEEADRRRRLLEDAVLRGKERGASTSAVDSTAAAGHQQTVVDAGGGGSKKRQVGGKRQKVPPGREGKAAAKNKKRRTE